MATIQLPTAHSPSAPPRPLPGAPPSAASSTREFSAEIQPQHARSFVTNVLLVLACVACLGPFLGKALHIDDPLFVWTARQIRVNPFDFFGFSVNWYTTATPMAQVTMNPPLTSYYLAAVTALFGEREFVLHLAFLLWPVAVVLGTYRLAQRYCGWPVLAALATLLAPVFLVSSTNVMSDVMMLAFWIWAVLYWERGLSGGSAANLYVAGLLVGLAFLTKYFALALVPLLLVDALLRRRRLGKWLIPLAIPVMIVAAYQYLTFRLYGKALLFGAAAYANDHRSHNLLMSLIVGLSFAGGCLGTVVCFAPVLWSRRRLAVGGMVACVLAALILLARPGVARLNGWAEAVQLSVFIGGGLCLVALAANDVYRRRDPASILLACWVIGTLLFAVFVNWTMNARSILPLVPAASILIVRRLEERLGDTMAQRLRWLAWPLVVTGVVALFVTAADYCMADAGRKAARELHQDYARGHGPIWFQGHWGFQYYLEALGGRVVDFDLMQGYEVPSVLLLPANSTYVLTLNPNQPYGVHGRYVQRMFKTSFDAFPWLATMHPAMDAGFYSCSMKQSLPYAFGAAPTEDYWVVLLADKRPAMAGAGLEKTTEQAKHGTTPGERERR